MRIQKLRKAMAALGADAALITSACNVRYYSGFTGTDSQLLITKTKALLFTDFRYTEQAEAETDFEVIETKGDKRMQTIFAHTGKGKTGVDLAGAMYITYKACLEYVDANNIVDLSDAVSAQRVVKDDAELVVIRKGAEHNDKLFAHLCGIMQPGMSENDVKAEIVYYMNKHGADIAFEPIVASGENGSLPHAVPGDRKLSKGDLVTMDFGCKFDGYCSDFTRTVAISDIDKAKQKVYDIVNCAGKMALDVLRPGMHACEVDKIAREFIVDKGYGNAFGHGLGHGVGLDIHEAPTLNPKGQTVLRPGMVVTVEPGIYIKGKYGVRIEDLCAVTDSGCDNFSSAPRELMII